ncbi:hypothetical protein NM688_g7035 [Phlebia brevispora]|uniref:Uncharacterized protein n=1 Tax=Phlebia brevispora TaxID=194682 RepID=A0ACC1S9P7_9APHY|nr:hypothetical protein NM688_g7035 [Phlebia brevispora]
MTAPRPGKRILYLPDRFFGQGAQAPFTAAETPGYVAGDDRDDRDLFPFHAPTGFASGNRNLPKQTQCISLLPAPLSTDRQQTTDIATVIKGLPHHRRLQTIKRCRTLWARLQAYADHEHLGHNTWNLPGAVFPDSVQQYEAVTSLSAWFVSHASRKSYAMVNCEAAVQDEVRAQLVAPLNDLIKTRYANRAMEPLKGVKKGWVDKYGTILASPPPDVFYPEYGRPNHAEHPEQGRNKAGFPDFILHNTASKDASGAFMEVKFFASFSDEVFMQIFSPVSAEPGSGQFNWGERKLVTKLLMQVWGEAHFFNSVWGSATNGSLICAFIKTGDRELTLSEPVSWESPGVLKALAGLTFASVDEKTARRQGIDLVDVLCPLQERDTGWMQTGANQPYHMHVGMFQGGIQNAGPAHQGYMELM